MIHLSYHPAFDAFHCIFRILRLQRFSKIESIESDKLRMLDYYLLFPWRAGAVRLAQRDVGLRRIAKRAEAKEDYATLPPGDVLLERMRPSQTAALQTLAQDGVVDGNGMRNGVIEFKEFDVPPSLSERIDQANAGDEDTMKIVTTLSSYPLLGSDGLKARTSLLEYRYDAV